jgi:hypothetical protein
MGSCLEGYVPTLQQQIAEKFLSKLSESKAIDPKQIEQLRVLLARGKKPKTDDIVSIFCSRR